MKTSFWVFIIVAVFLVTFSVQNSGSTEITFLIWNIQISKAVIIIATFLIGLITGALYGYFSRKPTTSVTEKSNNTEQDYTIAEEDLDEDEEEKQ